MDDFGLTKEEYDRIKSVFASFSKVEEVVIYRSRAKESHKPAPDIDLTLLGRNLDAGLQNDIAFALDDLLLPYKFDLSTYDALTSPELLAHIHRVGRRFYKKRLKR